MQETFSRYPGRTHRALTLGTLLVLSCFDVRADSPAQAADAARIARGVQVLTELNGGAPQPVFEAMRKEFPFLADATAGYALGDVWGRKVLDPKTRQLAAVAAFAALGLRPFLKVHAGYALNMGATPDELKEVIYMVTVPAGFPRAIEASQVLQELFRERAGSAPARTQ